MIYYHHGLQTFMHYNDAFHQEMKSLKPNIRQGLISAISAGEPITINGTDLFPVDLIIDDQHVVAPEWPDQ